MQKLEIYQSLWGMEQRHPKEKEPADESKFRKIKAGGFDGVCIDLTADEVEQFKSIQPLFADNELGCMVNAFPYQLEDLNPVLNLAKEFNACFVNIIGGVMPIDYKDGIPVVRRWMDDASKAEVEILFETHRDSILNDLYYTLQLIDAVPEMRLCADLSHFVVDREMWTPINERDQNYINTILDRSECFQGRVAARGQIQIQLGFPQHQVWVEVFKNWWKEGIKRWKTRNDDDATLIFLCELGPPAYAITDENQLELSDRWEEALLIKSWIESIWCEV